MKTIQRSFFALFCLLNTGSAISGTPGLTGQYSGDFKFIAYAHPEGNPNSTPTYMGEVMSRIAWEWDFDTGIANFRFDQGLIISEMRGYDLFCAENVCDGLGLDSIHGYILTIGVPITVHSPVTFTDNGDGTYSGPIDFQVYNSAFGFPAAMLPISWEITRVGNTLTFQTNDGDGNGYPGTVIGSEPDWGGFPFPFEPTWNGDARLDGADSNGDGLTDTQAIALELDPDLVSGDSDGDGATDVAELGADFNTPLDSDTDGIIDALEPGTDAQDASRATGLRFSGRNASFDDVTLLLDVQMVNDEALVHKPNSGKELISFPSVIFAFDKSGLTKNSPMALFHFISDAAGSDVTARLHFSGGVETRLPDKLLLYRVDTSETVIESDDFYLQSSSQWTKVDDYTIDLHIKDGGPMDADGLENGSVEVAFTLANNVKGDFHITSGNGSVSSWLLLVLSLLLFARSLYRQPDLLATHMMSSIDTRTSNKI